jgi:hypothetical protein
VPDLTEGSHYWQREEAQNSVVFGKVGHRIKLTLGQDLAGKDLWQVGRGKGELVTVNHEREGLVFSFYFVDRVSLCCSSWPQTHDPPGSVSQELGL